MDMQQLDMLLSGAMHTYIFKYAFETRNPGYTFDFDSWIQELQNVTAPFEEELTDEEMMARSEKVDAKVRYLVNNLDDYKIEKQS